MRKTKLRKNNGITLIALVITIIVLLILAGVAIAMLSGQNGILNKAKEAKENSEDGEIDELGKLLGYELELADKNYKYQYGYVTGIELDYEKYEIKNKVKDLEDIIEPSGYKVTKKYNEKNQNDEIIAEKEKANLCLATGMTIEKNGYIIARIIVFGDVNCDGIIDIEDVDRNGETLKDFQKIALDVNGDGKINEEDFDMINLFDSFSEVDMNQNRTITVFAEDIKFE